MNSSPQVLKRSKIETCPVEKIIIQAVKKSPFLSSALRCIASIFAFENWTSNLFALSSVENSAIDNRFNFSRIHSSF